MYRRKKNVNRKRKKLLKNHCHEKEKCGNFSIYNELDSFYFQKYNRKFFLLENKTPHLLIKNTKKANFIIIKTE